MTPSPISHTHKWNITSSLELLLAKIAGHDVDLSTMTPPVATNLTEELLLEIADRLDNSGGEGGGFMKITISSNEAGIETMDHTWQEIYDAYVDGSYVSVVSINGEASSNFDLRQQMIQSVIHDGDNYFVLMYNRSEPFIASSSDECPSYGGK